MIANLGKRDGKFVPLILASQVQIVPTMHVYETTAWRSVLQAVRRYLGQLVLRIRTKYVLEMGILNLLLFFCFPREIIRM